MSLTCRNTADLGSALRKRRKELGYTQADVRSRLGFSERLVGDIERGKGGVACSKYLQLARSLGFDVVLQRRDGHAD